MLLELSLFLYLIILIRNYIIVISAPDNWIIAFKLLRAFGLFGFAGGMTNWLAIRMMFDKIPFLIGR